MVVMLAKRLTFAYRHLLRAKWCHDRSE